MSGNWVMDIEANGLLDYKTVDYSQSPYKLLPHYKVHCVVFRNVDTKEVVAFYEGGKLLEDFIPQHEHLNFQDMKPWIHKNVEKVIGHNIINFDLLVMRLMWSMKYRLPSDEKQKAVWDGKYVDIVDTLVMSRLLNCDRFGGHSLDSWGQRVGRSKISFGEQEEQWEVFTPEMLAYCIRDTEVNALTYKALMNEWGDWQWGNSFALEQRMEQIVTDQSHIGFYFNKELALECVEELNKFMKDIEERVEPLLPPKAIGKTAAKNFIPPKIQMKKDGSLSSHMERFLDKVGGIYIGKEPHPDQSNYSQNLGEVHIVELYSKRLTLPLAEGVPVIMTEPMKLSHQEDMKLYLLSLGWEPMVWKEKDLTLGANKRKLTKEKYLETVEAYLENTLGEPWERHRAEHLGVSVSDLRSKLLNHKLEKPLKVRTTPSYTINQDKELDPSLVHMGNKVEWVGDVVKWLTYRHRRNAIYSEATDTKKTATGWLANPRLEIDGRIPTPAISMGTPSGRMKHINVANIPKVSTLYGDKLRSLFTIHSGHFQLGWDADAIEARTEGHYASKYRGGKEYAEALTAEKPNDTHTLRAKALDITRDEAKTLKYALTFGAQAGRVSAQLGWDIDKSQQVFDAFWEDAVPLAQLKDAVVKYWKNVGKKEYMVGIDGRKLWSRSQHSLLNNLFQSAAAICMKRASVWLIDELEREDCLLDPWEDNIYKGVGCFPMIHYHDEIALSVHNALIKWKTFKEEDEAKTWKGVMEKKGWRMGDVGHKGDMFYVTYSKVGHYSTKSIEEAGKYYNLRVKLTAGYQCGDSWATTH